MACSKSCQQTEGCTSNALELDIVIDKILEYLPIRVAARTSVLSEQWRRSWLSLRTLKFDKNFWEGQENNWLDCSCIISSILLHHNGPVHYFYLDIPVDFTGYGDLEGEHGARLNHGHWLSFLSKNAIRDIVINNKDNCFRVSSYIFACSQLVQLKLTSFTFSHPPKSFGGFPSLTILNLFKVHFAHEDILCSILANCSTLATLILVKCTGVHLVKINVPSVKSLTLVGYLESLSFRNFPSLRGLYVGLKANQFTEKLVTNIVDVVNVLANSRQLRIVIFGGLMCQIMVAGGVLRSRALAFNHVTHLYLHDLDYTCFDAFGFIMSMVERFPYLKKLNISVIKSKYANDHNHKLDYNLNNKLDHLVEVQIKGTPGSIAELKLIEYLLAVSVVLKQLSYKPMRLSDDSEMLEFSRALNKLPRASPEARLIC